MATIICLPDEVIIIILGYNDISIEDIFNFICVFQQFFWAIQYDEFWRQKFFQRWPSAKKHYDNQSKENEQKDSEEKEQKDKESLNFIETGTDCAEQLQSYVFQIIHKHYYDNDNYYDDVGDNEATNKYYNNTIDNLILFEDVLSLISNFDEIIYKPENSLKYFFFLDEIKNLLTQSLRNDCNLTKRYCHTKIFHYMRQCLVRKMWNRFEEQPDREQLLERTATIVARWIHPQKDVFYSYVKASLDNIALEVLNYLRQIYPDHSIFSTSAETFSYWKNNNIDDNHWNEAEGKQIMDTLEKYIFDNFQPCKMKDTNLEYMCLDHVLRSKYGQKLILLIIYHSVARRLGLRCDVVSMPKRSYNVPTYCIFWKPKYATNSLENVRCFSINFEKFPYDPVNQQWTLYSTRHSRNVSVITAKLMWRELRDLFADLINQDNNILEIINPYDSRFYGLISRKIRLRFKKTVLLNRSRPEDVKFAVGMIVTHSYQSTGRCTGVIIGWHQHVDTYVKFEVSNPNLLCPSYFYKQCEMPLNHCDNFNYTKQQTNYIILSDNNKMCYVGEDAITLTTPKWIDNSEIGRYFCKFENTHYVPNKMLAKFYPHDAAITAKITISENQEEK